MTFLNFLDSKNKIPEKSSINWSHSNGNVTDFDAYLPIRTYVISNNPDLIPPHDF